MAGANPDRTAFNPSESELTAATVGGLHQLWSAATDPGAAAGPAAAPVVSNVGIHVAAGQAFYGFDPVTGARLWRFPADPLTPFTATAPPIADGNRVLVSYGFAFANGQHDARWLDAATGAELSQTTPGFADSRRGSVQLVRQVTTGGGSILGTAITISDPDDPTVGWSDRIGLQDGHPLAPPLTLGTSRFYQAGYGVIGTTGALGNGVRAWPVNDPIRGCIPGVPGNYVCPDWTTPLDGNTAVSPVLDEAHGRLYVVTDTGHVYAIDSDTGAVLWQGSAPPGVTAPPALADGVLYIAAGGALFAFAADGCGDTLCSQLWEASVGLDGDIVQPAVAGGVVYVGRGDGTVAAFSTSPEPLLGRPPLWSTNAGSAITGAPAVSDGRLYVGTADGLA